MIRGDKSGQFYLIASAIIVVIIFGLVLVRTVPYQESSSYVIEDMGESLEIESQKVLDYDLLNNPDEINNFMGDYSGYIGDGVEMYFIIGDDSDMDAYFYLDGSGTDISSNLTVDSEIITLNVKDINYEFELNEGQNFYFILSRNIGGETHVYTN